MSIGQFLIDVISLLKQRPLDSLDLSVDLKLKTSIDLKIGAVANFDILTATHPSAQNYPKIFENTIWEWRQQIRIRYITRGISWNNIPKWCLEREKTSFSSSRTRAESASASSVEHPEVHWIVGSLPMSSLGRSKNFTTKKTWFTFTTKFHHQIYNQTFTKKTYCKIPNEKLTTAPPPAARRPLGAPRAATWPWRPRSWRPGSRRSSRPEDVGLNSVEDPGRSRRLKKKTRWWWPCYLNSGPQSQCARIV